MRLEQPLLAFETQKHAGALGKSYSFVRGARVMALKKAEDSNDIIIRTIGDGTPRFTAKVISMRRTDGQERALTNPQPCTLCTYAVQLWSVEATPPLSKAQALPAHSKTMELPPGTTRVHLVMNADGDRDAIVRIGDVDHHLRVQDASGFIGQWDTRLWEHREEILPPRPDAPPNAPPRRTRGLVYAGLTPGFIKPAPVDSFALTKPSYSYRYRFEYTLPATGTTLTLPDDPHVHVYAVTASDAPYSVRPLQPLYDTLRR